MRRIPGSAWKVGALLSYSLLMNGANSQNDPRRRQDDGETFPCPSEDCWEVDSRGQCVLKDGGPACPYSVTCSSGIMNITLPDAFFGPLTTKDFTETDECAPTVNEGFYSYENSLESCGTTVMRSNEDLLLFERTIEIGTQDALQLLDSTIVTYKSSSYITAKFTCSFPATAELTAEDFAVETSNDHWLTSIVGNGTWESSFRLEFYTNADFTTEVNEDSAEIYHTQLGQEIFVQSTWNLNFASLRYYISSCKVKDLVSKTEVEIVKNSCYAEAVSAKPIGDVAEEAEDAKVVQTISQFMYKAFTFNATALSDPQEMSCTATLCIYKDGENDCDGYVDRTETNLANPESSCPAQDGYEAFQFRP